MVFANFQINVHRKAKMASSDHEDIHQEDIKALVKYRLRFMGQEVHEHIFCTRRQSGR